MDLMGFLSSALREGIDCSLEELSHADQFSTLTRFLFIEQLQKFLDSHEITATPGIASESLEWHDSISFSRTKKDSDFVRACNDALRDGEGHRVEYKQTVMFDVRRSISQRGLSPDSYFSYDLLHEIVKTVIAFLNADGGTLLIGVCDDGTIYGLDQDFRCKNFVDRDALELFIRDIFTAKILDYRVLKSNISLAFVRVEEKDVAVVLVSKRRRKISACYPAVGQDLEIVYQRDGNRSLKLQAREIEQLVLQNNQLIDRN